MIGPTLRQLQVLEQIEALTTRQGPRYRDLAKAANVRSLNYVHEVVRALERKGLLEASRDGRSRVVSSAGRRWLRRKVRAAG